MSHTVGVPRLPEPPKEWSPGWMQNHILVMTNWMLRMTAESNAEAAAESVREVTVSSLVGLADGFILVDTTGGNVTLTLPDPALVIGREFSVKRSTAGANTLDISPAVGLIDNAASASIVFQYETLRFKSDGSNYWIF